MPRHVQEDLECREEHDATRRRMEKLSKKAKSSMPRHVRCKHCVCRGIQGACRGMRDEEKLAESSMPQHTKKYVATCVLEVKNRGVQNLILTELIDQTDLIRLIGQPPK